MSDNPTTAYGDRLGFIHDTSDGLPDGPPCTAGDDGLLFVEKYVGVEARYVIEVSQDSTIVLAPDAVSDEVLETVAQYIECRYCDGASVPVDASQEVEYR